MNSLACPRLAFYKFRNVSKLFLMCDKEPNLAKKYEIHQGIPFESLEFFFHLAL